MHIIVAGDYCPINRVAEYIEGGDYSFVFKQINSLLSDSSYSIVNFECPIESEGTPIVKQGPCLRCNSKSVEALKWAGFDCVTLANNHFKDYGDAGCKRTIETLRNNGIDYVGGGMSLTEAQTILYKRIDDKVLAIINFCENEFSIAKDNGAGSAPLDLIDNFRQIKEARSKADYVIVIVHGGHEYYQLPSPRMKKIYQWFVDLGSDAVINHHQHCFSGYEIYNGKPIFYGLGNFCFDGNRCGKDIWYDGFMLSLDLNDNKTEVSLMPYSQCNRTPQIELMEGEKKTAFFRKIEELNSIICNDIELERCYENWCLSQYLNIEYLLTPYTSRIMRALWRRHLLPSFLPKRKLVNLYNKVLCEAHRDTLINYLSNKIGQND
jgi:poly-gamma-glutamate synthesis protein (capsule biosynthesis protein)